MQDVIMSIKILGAGLSGLSSAINLAIEGKEVEIFERKGGVGEHMRPNYQGLLRTHNDPMGYLNKYNLNPDFDLLRLSKAFICTKTRDLDVTLKEPIDFVLRGGKDSLEQGLYEQAKSFGVKFHFNQKKEKKDVDKVFPNWMVLLYNALTKWRIQGRQLLFSAAC
jgi:flavin-dependent dehydrogenase